MNKGILASLLFTLAASSSVYANTKNAMPVVCNVLVLKATSQIEDQSKTMSAVSVSVKNATDYGEGSSAIVVGGNKVEVHLIINGDELVDGVLGVSQSTLINGKRELMSSVLMKNTGVGKDGGWDQGPAGALQWRLMQTNSLSEAALHARLSTSALSKLKKYGVSSNSIDNLYPVYQKVAEAVKSGDLVEGEPIGTALFMGCYQ